MANGVALIERQAKPVAFSSSSSKGSEAESHGRKGKLGIRHASALKRYLISNNMEDTHIRFDRLIQFPYKTDMEKNAFREMFEEAFKKQDGRKERAP